MEVTKLLQAGIVGTDAWPKVMRLEFSHGGGCKGKKRTRDKDLNTSIFEWGKPRMLFEVKALIPAIMMCRGCKMEGLGKCEVEKGGMAGIYLAHCQNTKYTPRETQETPKSDNSSRYTPDSRTESKHRQGEMYDRMKLDNRDDEDYQPSEDVGMTLEKGKNTEGMGLGNSKHAVENEEIEKTQEEIVSSQGNRDLVACLEDYEKGNITPAVVNEDEMITEVGEESSETKLGEEEETMEVRVKRLEEALKEERDRNDMLKDMIMEIMAEGCRKCRKGQ
ncbi:hypothetical protein C7212DRAFT_366131 [Tuber magnatum]|uniref:Uncharacterized protein n=1 Tax=Tuber magnatum TaxID=42249 RepID=A0A317SFC3_9PEZI|nr:hypothetical protein C7212DRAFT_366131 [Tuber magnatum]